MQSIEFYYIFLLLLCYTLSKTTDVEKAEFCAKLTCQSSENNSVCGFRTEGDGFRLKLFENECELLKYGCNADEEKAYGLINLEYCEQSFAADFNKRSDYPERNEQKLNNMLFYKDNEGNCKHFHCSHNMKNVCGIRKDGVGYRVQLFRSKCDMMRHNCENDLQFTETDRFICESYSISDKDKLSKKQTQNNKKVNENINNVTNLVVVNSNYLGNYSDINDTVDAFFAASHVFDLPMKEVLPLNTRRRLLKYAGPVKVFVPWIVKPDNISNDSLSIPTLSSCYHKCPFRCPDTYAPVCGVPGIVAREPSIMFQNHCFMDVAQCKMFWENKSATAHSSSYVEASFLFCMGDEMNAVYRFLPAIRTLQHMGRLKKKGKFRSKLRNFRHLSEFRSGRPKFMG